MSILRFVTATLPILNYTEIEDRLRVNNEAWRLKVTTTEQRQYADLYYSDRIYGELDIHKPEQHHFNFEQAELYKILDHGKGNPERVRQLLTDATACYSMKALPPNGDLNFTFDVLTTILDVLFDAHEGLLFLDDMGCYDENGRWVFKCE